MPIQPTYPGVYVQEIPSGVRTITGVATSIGAFFGRAAKGPIDKAVRCLSYADFLRAFGGPHPLSDLAASVSQFFANGGTDCYVVRLARGAAPATLTLRNIITPGRRVLTATAKQPGTWGQGVKLIVDYNTPNPDDTFNLTVVHQEGNVVIKTEPFFNLSMNPRSPRFAPPFVTQSSSLIDLTLHAADMGDPNDAGSFINTVANTPAGFSEGRRPFAGASAAAIRTAIQTFIDPLINLGAGVAPQGAFWLNMDGRPEHDIYVDLASPPLAIPANPTVAELFGNAGLGGRINAAIAGVLPGVTVTVAPSVTGNVGYLRITSDSTDAPNVTIRSAGANDFAGPMMLGIDNGGIEVARFANMRPVPNALFFSGTDAVDPTIGANGLNAFANLAQNLMTGIRFDGAPAPIATNLVTAGAVNYNDATGGVNGLREKLRIIQQAVNGDANAAYTAELWGHRLAFRKKTGTINDLATVTTDGSAVLQGGFRSNTQRYSLGMAGASPFQVPPVAADAGSDGTVPQQAEYQGNPVTHTGFYALDKVDLFNLMVLPGDREYDVVNVRGGASNYCESRRAFLVIDAPATWTQNDHPVADAATVNAFRVGVSKQHSGIFYPRVQYSDNGIRKYIGPSGMIAGLMARTDSQRGVWKAPAGIDADLRGVSDLELDMTDAENGVLNKLGVNCLRKFPNGIVSWGSRTLDGSDDFGSEWKYIPIRRLALFIEESLFRGTKWVVFETNDEPLWAKIRMNLNAFMMGLFRQGAFQGSTPDKAFFVKCDGETTTANDRNLGIVNIQVGFAPLKPAEFVIITIQQIPDV